VRASLSPSLSAPIAALSHAVRPASWREAFQLHLDRAGVAVPLRVGAAVAVVFLLGGLTGQQQLTVSREVVDFGSVWVHAQ
jgi:hypothetical protein